MLPHLFRHLNYTRNLLQTSADRKSTRLNSSHLVISYAVFCLKKEKQEVRTGEPRRLPSVSRVPRGSCAHLRASAGVVSDGHQAPFGVCRGAVLFFLDQRRPPVSPLFPFPPLSR